MKNFFRKTHEDNDDGIGHEPRADAFEAKGCGRGHHGRGGEGTPLNIWVLRFRGPDDLEAVPTLRQRAALNSKLRTTIADRITIDQNGKETTT